jgi:hypothetical protein
MQEAASRTEQPTGTWANPTVIGLMGFALATMIVGLSNLPHPYSNGFANNWAVFGVVVFFGGLAQLGAGVIGLRTGNLFAGSAFIGYGSFWLAYVSTQTGFLGLGGFAITNPAAWYGLAGFFFVWLLFTLTFLINSMKHGWGLFFVFLFLFVSFILLVVKCWQLGAGNTISTGESWAIGGIIILTGLTAWYVASAHLTNSNYGRTVLPA